MERSARLLFVCLVAFGLAAPPALAQEVRYHVSWGAPNGHYLNVEMTFVNPGDGPLSVRIPSWRPGRYIIQNFAKNIIRFAAQDGSGNPLPFHKTDKATWEIDAAAGQEVTVTYQSYAHQKDAGSSYLDETEAFVNPVTMLMYIPGHETTPAILSIDKPDDWKTATALNFSNADNGYRAASYHDLVDSPLIISPTLKEFTFEFGGTTFEVAIQGEGKYDIDKFLADLQNLVEVEANIMGVIPFDRYVFMYHFVPNEFGHGVEHKNSASIMVGPSDFTNPGLYRRLIGVSAHEFWHAWLVERIRPEAIYLPDYSTEEYTSMLWLYEGVTSYYGSLALRRAGLITEEAFENGLAGAIGRYKDDPARAVTSPAASSWDYWTKSVEAPPNTFFSFYTAGNVLGAVLDMEVRGRTRNAQSLDDVMRYLYQTYAAHDIGVPENGLQEALEKITSGTFQPFFDDHVYGTKPIDYDRYLYYAGYTLEETKDDSRPEAQFGVGLKIVEGGLASISSLDPDGAAFAAGMDIDDVIIAIDGKKVTNAGFLDFMKDYEPGQTVHVTAFRRDELTTFDVTLKGGGNRTYKLQRMDNTSILQNQTRRDWLGLAAG